MRGTINSCYLPSSFRLDTAPKQLTLLGRFF